jgi:hypothetical protein
VTARELALPQRGLDLLLVRDIVIERHDLSSTDRGSVDLQRSARAAIELDDLFVTESLCVATRGCKEAQYRLGFLSETRHSGRADQRATRPCRGGIATVSGGSRSFRGGRRPPRISPPSRRCRVEAPRRCARSVRARGHARAALRSLAPSPPLLHHPLILTDTAQSSPRGSANKSAQRFRHRRARGGRGRNLLLADQVVRLGPGLPCVPRHLA